MAKLKASCDTFAKQIATYQLDMEKWLTRFHEASAELTKLKNGIKDPVSKKSSNFLDCNITQRTNIYDYFPAFEKTSQIILD